MSSRQVGQLIVGEMDRRSIASHLTFVEKATQKAHRR
jgi:hypothetical protein